MMVLLFNICSSVSMLWCCLIVVKGESLCRSELLKQVNVSTELQSDVLLPCSFNPALLGSDKTADVAVVWSQRNTTVHGLVEITQQGEVKFWDYKGGRVKAFPELSESGNFSILIQKVQPYDLSLYHCELFNGSNCSIAYQELQLFFEPWSSLLLWSTVGALAGVIVLLAVFTTRFLHAKRRQNATDTEVDYENAVGGITDSDGGNKSIENPIYETSCQAKSTNCAREEGEACSSDTPVYATVKKGKLVNST